MPKSLRIPAGKKRYTLTLTTTTMDRMHAFFGKNHVPKSFLSSMVDELLADMLTTWDELEKAQERQGATLGFGDVLSAVGKVIKDRENVQGRLL